jgi:hypothetical protein
MAVRLIDTSNDLAREGIAEVVVGFKCPLVSGISQELAMTLHNPTGR